MMEDNELKPCPFCGEPGAASIDNGGQFPEITYTCTRCLLNIQTVDEWQTRPAEDALRAELQAAREDAERLEAAMKFALKWLVEMKSPVAYGALKTALQQ